MVRRIAAMLLGAAVVLAAASCGNSRNNEGDGKMKVSVSFNALKEFADAVGGDKISVSVIIPDGTEPHGFEPKAQDLAALKNADIFVMNGLGMEAWAEDAVSAAGNTGLIVVDASAGVETIATAGEAHEDEDPAHEEAGEEEHHHEYGAYDPHIWLSAQCARTMAGNIKDALVKADPDNSTYYEKNYTAFSDQLQSLYTEYSDKFSTAPNKSFVTGHAAFAYLCRDFGLLQNSVEDVFAEGEPSAQQLAALVDYCRENQIKTIFTEALVSAAVSETLAREVGAKVQPIYTMASAENGKSYLERMEENLKVIYESLR
jgi:zinc transport system substrate-binding protein